MIILLKFQKIPKKIEIRIDIDDYRNYKEIEKSEYNYNEILLINRSKQTDDWELGNFIDRNSLTQEQINSAIRIKIKK